MAIWSWFHGKIIIGLRMTAFWKKVCQKQVFSACEKGAFFSVSVYFGNMPNFAGLWCPNHLTHRDSWGIIGKIISIAFIWYLVVLCVTASLVTITSWKSGLILSSLKMLISVLSNKAVLGYTYALWTLCEWFWPRHTRVIFPFVIECCLTFCAQGGGYSQLYGREM